MSASDLITALVQSQKVVVFSKSYCPYCVKAKAVFDSIGQPFLEVELEEKGWSFVLAMGIAHTSTVCIYY